MGLGRLPEVLPEMEAPEENLEQMEAQRRLAPRGGMGPRVRAKVVLGFNSYENYSPIFPILSYNNTYLKYTSKMIYKYLLRPNYYSQEWLGKGRGYSTVTTY